MSDKDLVAKLKNLGTKRAGGSPDAQWLLSARETLLMQVRNTVNDTRTSAWSARGIVETFRIFASGLSSAVIVPVAVVLLMLGANVGAAALMGFASGALPGDSLYQAKLMAESVNLRFAGGYKKVERRLNVAARRLDEMARLSSSVAADKEEKISKVAGLFSTTILSVRADLESLRSAADAETAVKAAILVDLKSDEFHKLFDSGDLPTAPAVRLALSNLDQTSVTALETLIEKQSLALNVLPEAQLTSAVGRKIDTVAARATAGPALKAVEEAKELFTQGNFKAAVLKVLEATQDPPPLEEEPATTTEAATSTPQLDTKSTP